MNRNNLSKIFWQNCNTEEKNSSRKKRSWKENWNGEINYSWCTITKKKFLVFSLSFFSWSFVSSFLSGSSQMAAAHLIGRMRLKANNLFFYCCFFRSWPSVALSVRPVLVWIKTFLELRGRERGFKETSHLEMTGGGRDTDPPCLFRFIYRWTWLPHLLRASKWIHLVDPLLALPFKSH